MRDLDLISLRYFVSVCDTGSISRAAEQEHLVASAVSKRLMQLEQNLGVLLLQRKRHGVAPTAAGKLLLQESRMILANARRVAQDVSSFGAGIRGQVGLLATVSAIAEKLPDDIAAFLKSPDRCHIYVQLDELFSGEIVRRIRDGTASLGVLWDSGNLEDLKREPYRTDHLAVVVAADHPLARRRRCAFVDTLEFDHVGLASAAAANVLMTRTAAVAGKTLNWRTQVTNFDAALRIVRAQLGIAVMPREIALPHASADGLVVVPLQDAWATRRFVVCYRDRDELSHASALLLDFLAATARATGR